MMAESFTMSELRQCAEREAKMRRQVYQNRVLTKRMSKAQADAEIAKMDAIAIHFAKLLDRERLL
jgi:hypothetical protein